MANRLADETSPYLLQHKDNPVDWYPWGDEALAKARDEDKPLLVSIGYAACHWCHVMERESFEDAETAALMNENFVNVKVDREERPDVDSVYMAATQALTGHGGWPMTVFVTADGVPFLAGTYFPPEPRHGMPSFRQVLDQVHEFWTTRRQDLLAQGQRLVEAIERASPRASHDPLGGNLLVGAAAQIMSSFDKVNGGFGSAPKFPQAPVLEFLMRMHRRPGVREALELTLRRMALGGMYDQIGGGFARYSVDATWTIPHFEKMLYDNAQLARTYTHAWQLWKDPLYQRIATETLEYLLRDMRDSGDGFHSSEDADSEGVEGKFYAWSHEEFTQVAPEAVDYYGITPEGNFEGKNNPVVTQEDVEPPTAARTKLRAARAARIRPARDDKVLASWNGLAIGALAEAGAAFGRADFVAAAKEAAAFVLAHMREPSDPEGRLLHSYRAGRAQISGFLEDYAYLTDGLLALWEATFETRWLEEAVALARQAVDLFADPAGGLFTTASDAQQLVVRQKEVVESATPAPGGVLALALQRIAHLLDDRELAKPAVDSLRVARLYMERAAQAVPTWLSALDFYVSTPKEIAFTGPLDDDRGEALVDVVTSRFLPNRVLAARGTDGSGETVDRIALLRDKPATDVPTAYVCERFVCQAPTSDPEELQNQLGSV
jgi:uncharacterized protein YyaL (SSP411 family)